jgi:hypothetical protein
MSRPRLNGKLINVILDRRLLGAIKDFQHEHKLDSRMAAIRRLLGAGLAAAHSDAKEEHAPAKR